MKHSIRYILFKYSRSGKGQRIDILRGMEIRSYSYSSMRAMRLSLLTVDWKTRYFDTSIDMTRNYPEST